jgi:Cu2+-containing amine oxidase
MRRAEDYPVMPLELHGFEIKRVGFSSRNPALDIPRR